MAKTLPNGDLAVGSVEVAGVLEDEFGNKWTIPAGDLSEDTSFLLTDPFKLPKQDPRFHYEFVDDKFVSDYVNSPAQFVFVSREEVGLGDVSVANPVEGAPEVNKSKREVYRLGTLSLMKTPKVFADRIHRAQKMAADAAVESTLAQKDVEEAARIREAGLQYEIDRTTLSYKVVEKNPKPFKLQGENDNRIDRTKGGGE